jgi:hypothetical protein
MKQEMALVAWRKLVASVVAEMKTGYFRGL